jgi:hypothetical protein
MKDDDFPDVISGDEDMTPVFFLCVCSKPTCKTFPKNAKLHPMKEDKEDY